MMFKIQAFCHFKINIFISTTKATPINNRSYRFSPQTVSNKYGPPNLAKLILGDVRFLHLHKTYTYTYLFIYKQILR